MKRMLQKKLNNRGNTLVMVIVAMLFIGIIASLILSIVIKNLENSKSYSYGTANFYSAENGLDEVRSYFDTYADKAVRKAYSEWLAHYTVDSNSEDQKKTFIKAFAEQLKTDLDTIISDLTDVFPAGSGVECTVGEVEVVEEGDETKVVIRDIVVEYTDDEGHTSIVTTDMVYSVEYPGFSSSSAAGVNDSVADYVIVTDEKITNTGMASSTITNLTGNIYGGGYDTTSRKYTGNGIEWSGNGSKLNLISDIISSQSTIKIDDGADLDAKGVRSGFETYNPCNIWTKNILLTDDTAVADPVTVTIKGNCYVMDDLTVEARNSLFKLEGTYYGYSVDNLGEGADPTDDAGVGLVGTAEGSSAIIINKENAKVDLTSVTKLWLAGRSFVSIPANYAHKDADNSLNAGEELSFLMGESISYKAIQSAYLVPGECIIGVGHNPMTATEFATIKGDQSKVDFSLVNSMGEGTIDISRFVDSNKKYRTAYVKYPTGETRVYLYINFLSPNKATEFFQSYNVVNSELNLRKMSLLDNGYILLSDAAKSGSRDALMNAGNVILYTPAATPGADATMQILPGRTGASDKNSFRSKQIELKRRYTGLCTALKENFQGNLGSGFLTDTIVDYSIVPGTGSIDNAITEPTYTTSVSGPGIDGTVNYKLYVGHDITISQNETDGLIIIASGDVTIKNGASFKGLVIARGKVSFLGTGSKLTSDPRIVSYLINRDQVINSYFANGIGGKGDGSQVLAADLIKVEYINWRKN